MRFRSPLLGVVFLTLLNASPCLAVTSDVLIPSDNASISTSAKTVVAPPANTLTTPSQGGAATATPPADTSSKEAAEKPITKIVKIPYVEGVVTPTNPGIMPLAMKISLDDRAKWIAALSALANSQLGLTPDQVANNCMTSITGKIFSTKGVTPFEITQGTAEVRYGGTLSSVMMNVSALCKANSIKEGAGLVFQVGDRYRVTLLTGACGGPEKQASQLSLSYGGIATLKCAYTP